MSTPRPTPQQTAVLQRAVTHPTGVIAGAGTVVRRSLLRHGWAESRATVTAIRNGVGGTTDIATSVLVITAAGRAVVSSEGDR